MKISKVRINFYDGVIISLTFMLFVIKIIPQLQYTLTGPMWSILYQALFAVWLIFTILKSGFWLRVIPVRLFAILVWLIYLTLQFLIYPDAQFGFLSLNLTFWEPLIIFIYFDTYMRNSKMKYYIADLITLVLIISLLFSIKTVNANEMAARIASSGHSIDDYLMTGNYSFTATITILVGVMIALILKAKLFHKVMAWVFIAGTIIFIFKANLMISILCLLVSISLIPFLDDKRYVTPKKVILLSLLIILIAVIVPFVDKMMINILLILENTINSNEISKKIDMIIIFLQQQTMVGNLESRIALDMISIKTFFNNMLIGIGPQNNADLYFKTKLGLHATLFDEFARYGIIGMAIMITAFYKNYKILARKYEGSFALRALRGGYITFIVISLTNPVLSANVGISLFFLLPVYVERIKQIDSI